MIKIILLLLMIDIHFSLYTYYICMCVYVCIYIYIIMMMQNIINHSEMYILHHVAMAMLHSFKKMNKTQTRHIHTHCVEKSFWNPMRHHLFNIDIALIVFLHRTSKSKATSMQSLELCFKNRMTGWSRVNHMEQYCRNSYPMDCEVPLRHSVG